MKTLFTLCFIVCAGTSFAQWQHPSTKTADSSSIYFGTTYKDSYRWLENFKDTSVVSWFSQQADLANFGLNKLNGRNELVAEWKELDELQPPRINGHKYETGKIFYRKAMPGEKVRLVGGIEFMEDKIFAISRKDAPIYKLLQISVKKSRLEACKSSRS